MSCLSTRCVKRVRLAACALVLAALCCASVGCVRQGRDAGVVAAPECANATLEAPRKSVALPQEPAGSKAPEAPPQMLSSAPQPEHTEQSVLQVD